MFIPHRHFWVPCRICSSTVSVNQLLKLYRHYCNTITLAGENVETHQVFKVFLRLLKVSFSRSLTSFCGGRSHVVCPNRIAKPMAERTSYVVTMNDLAELDCENLFIHVRVVGAASWIRTSPYSLGPYIYSPG